MPNKMILIVILILLGTSAQARPGSILGAAPMSGRSAHHIGVGWPSLSYEYWRAGRPDIGIGGEIVYGDWAGNFSDVKIGFAANVPMRWRLRQRGRADFAFRFAPGLLLAEGDGGGNPFVFAIRSDMGVPISVNLSPMVNLITGATSPISVFFVEDADPFVVVPILARIGVEVKADPMIYPWFLFELGPALAFGDIGSEVKFAFRVNVGVTFW